MRTASCTSSADCGNTTASGGWFSIQVRTLPCCARPAWEGASRLPNFAASAAIAAFTAFSLRGSAASSASAMSHPASLRSDPSRAAALPAKAKRRRDAGGASNLMARSDRFWRLDLPWTSAPDLRGEHSSALAIAPVFVAELIHQVALLEHDADEDVGRRHRGEQKVADCHH